MANEKNTTNRFESSLDYALQEDAKDELREYRNEFHIPKDKSGKDSVYLCGNSLGLQPKATKAFIDQELEDWKNHGVEGHFHAKNPWLNYHERISKGMAKIVGAKPIEVVVMNTLTTNLHLLMVSFYRPTKTRYKILIESDAFPSDRYAVESQVKFHGLDPSEAIVKIAPLSGESLLRMEDIESCIKENGSEIALILIGGVNYYTGQYFDLKKITELGHAQGCVVGFDLAHAAGNVDLNLHDTGCDFAAWCTYKYMNAGPGSIAGLFVHEKHAHDSSIPRFTGWWGHNKTTRFNMRHDFDPLPGAEGWQLSNPPIFGLTPVMASIEMFNEVGMEKLRSKSVRLTSYMEFLLHQIKDDRIHIITPSNPEERGCQLSIQIKNSDKRLFEFITKEGVIADWREPDVIRVAPVPLYNSFKDVYYFVQIITKGLKSI
ncbi:MAG: kynureninase [Bacteroidales bacterium]|nr:kynureninase [Bacteroidales bacterium]